MAFFFWTYACACLCRWSAPLSAGIRARFFFLTKARMAVSGGRGRTINHKQRKKERKKMTMIGLQVNNGNNTNNNKEKMVKGSA
jgi:hypothetical protein